MAHSFRPKDQTHISPSITPESLRADLEGYKRLIEAHNFYPTPLSRAESEQQSATQLTAVMHNHTPSTDQAALALSPVHRQLVERDLNVPPRLAPSAPAPIILGTGQENIWRMAPDPHGGRGLSIRAPGSEIKAAREQVLLSVSSHTRRCLEQAKIDLGIDRADNVKVLERLVVDLEEEKKRLVQAVEVQLQNTQLEAAQNAQRAQEALKQSLDLRRRLQMATHTINLTLRNDPNTYGRVSMSRDGASAQAYLDSAFGSPAWDSTSTFSSPGFGGYYPSPTQANFSSGNEARYYTASDVRHLLECGQLDLEPICIEAVPGAVTLLARPPDRFNPTSQLIKNLVSALGNGLEEEGLQDVICSYVLRYARDLCISAEGNRLCQAFLDKADDTTKEKFVNIINEYLLDLLRDKHRGRKVIAHATEQPMLEDLMVERLYALGIFETLRAGGVVVWRKFLVRCRVSGDHETFFKFAEALRGHWVDLACGREEGTIAVQQLVETLADNGLAGETENPGIKMMMDDCQKEILANIQRVSGDDHGHFLVERMLDVSATRDATTTALINADPPVARTIHGASICAKAVQGKPWMFAYLRKICTKSNGADIGLVTITKSPGGAKHNEMLRRHGFATPPKCVRDACIDSAATIRSTKDGVDLHSWATGQNRPLPRATFNIPPRIQESMATADKVIRPPGYGSQ